MLSPLLHATAKNNSHNDLNQLRNRIQALQKDLASKETSKLEAADMLKESERAISNIKRDLIKLAQEKKLADISFNQLLAQSKKIKVNIEEAQAQLEKLLYQQYLSGRQDNNWRMLLNQRNHSQIARDLYYIKRLAQTRSESINSLSIHLDELETITQSNRKKNEEISAILSKESQQKVQLEQKKVKRSNLLAKISGQISQQRKDINKLKRDEKRLSTLVRRIDNIVTRDNAPTAVYNNKLPNIPKQKQPFASLKGQLNLPVRGELVNRFGSPRSGNNITWNGLFIRSSNGAEIKAIADGNVVFADWFRGFGNLMIIDHGNSYMSLYGNNEANYKQVSDVIHGGDTIAIVGNSGGNFDPGLYFELRYQGKPFDPLTWIKIE